MHLLLKLKDINTATREGSTSQSLCLLAGFNSLLARGLPVPPYAGLPRGSSKQGSLMHHGQSESSMECAGHSYSQGCLMVWGPGGFMPHSCLSVSHCGLPLAVVVGVGADNSASRNIWSSRQINEIILRVSSAL